MFKDERDWYLWGAKGVMTMYLAQMKVRRFHDVFNAARADSPRMIDHETKDLRMRLMREELEELDYAFDCNRLPEIADAIGDLLYVTLGTAVACGINIDPIFEAIHNSNMAKLGGTVRADGKILKPEGWQPPNIRGLLIQQGWRP